MKNEKSSGQSLIEVVIAIAIASMIALGLVKATTLSFKNSGYSKDQNTATELAQKKMSEVIADRNQNPSDFFESLRGYGDEVSQDGQFCVNTRLDFIDLSLTPPDPSARMIHLTVSSYWGIKAHVGIASDCGENDYEHVLSFETNLTN